MPLQKSYSEHAGASKWQKRASWQRSYSHPVNLQNPNPRALQPVSASTKSKLNKFQYQPPQDDAESATTHNAECEGSLTATENAPASETIKDGVMATPVTRLDWRDLIEPGGSSECRQTRVSPNDRLLWDNKQDALYTAALSPMMPRKGKKRARSSSPTSSPAADKPHTPAVNVKQLTKALKSPHADPTLELWDRYSINGIENQTTSAGISNPALAHLMVSSSPRPSKDGVTQRGQASLRRAVSCGLNLPKRRRTDRLGYCSQKGSSQRELEAASKSSLVTALLDTVTSSINDQSPGASATQQIAESPSLNKRRPASPKLPLSDQKRDDAISEDSFSDYGVDEFDDDTLMELEASMNVAQEAVSSMELSEPKKTFDLNPKEYADDLEDLDDDIFDGAEDLLGELQAKTNRTSATVANGNDADQIFVDEFEDDIYTDVDLEAMELAATQSLNMKSAPQGTSGPKAKVIQRYLIKDVLEGEFVDQCGVTGPEKILLIQADNSKIMRTVCLRGEWFDTPAHADSYVHVIGDFSLKGQCVVDDAQNFLILHPDQLISSTVLADSFNCMRRAVLQDRVKATSEATPPLIYGTMLHEIFQEALLSNRWDLKYLASVIETIMAKHVEDLYTIKVGMADAREHLQSKMSELSHWAAAFVSSQPKANAVVEDRHSEKANMAVTKLLDVEEHIWSPMFGLKGNIDATVEVVMKDGHQHRTLTVPFEVKTGKHVNTSHVSQTMLYTLLLSDRYDIDITCGVLYYTETSKTMRIRSTRNDLRHMMIQRNELACYIRERSVKLPRLKRKHICGNCYAKTSCFVYHRLADDGDGESSGMNEKFDEVVQHLTPEHQSFFVKWENLLTKEEKESQKTKRELWTMTSSEREKKSRCFGDVVIEEGSSSVDTDNPRINRFHYTFVKEHHPPGFSFLESELNVGEPIVVSDEQGHFALAIGYVTAVRRQRISVAVDRRLHNARIRQPGFDELDNQVFASIMEVAPKGAVPQESEGKIKEPPVRYRLDLDEFSNGMATVRNNLTQLMANNVSEASKIRRLVVDLAAPRFKTTVTQYTVSEQESLNVDQRKAIEKVMSAQDYALVLGMPGTGKTTTIAHIIRALTSQGKSVLLTSHTHTAVDNILLKLRSDKIPILRLGAPAKVHPEVHSFAYLASQPRSTFDEIKEAWHGTPIVATTCLGINHSVFLERSFDYCIVDEASQITLPICAGPIRMARTFVLVGDHNQLPPVVRNEEAREGGLDISLFKLLSDAHPESVVNLAHQYRMCEDIMTLSNTLIYNGQLVCGTEALRKRKLDIPSMNSLKLRHYDASSIARPSTPRSFCVGAGPSRCWLYDVIDSEARVRFINTDTMADPPIREEAQGKRIVNSAEVNIVSQLVDSLLTVGVPADEIGVMTHYRAQLFMLKDKLKGFTGVEMHTTDRFQGRDKEVIVLSLVRSNDTCNIGDLLKDWRRINVAFTRAKTKLLVIGSMSTLKGSGDANMLSRFISLMEERDWIYDLPIGALESHHFDEFGTQITAMSGATSQKTTRSPRNIKASRGNAMPPGKENMRPSPKKARIGDRALLKGKLITRDILNEMTNGAY